MFTVSGWLNYMIKIFMGAGLVTPSLSPSHLHFLSLFQEVFGKVLYTSHHPTLNIFTVGSKTEVYAQKARVDQA